MLTSVLVVVAVITLTLLSKWTNNRNNVFTPHFMTTIRTLVLQSTRWSTVASQDQNPVVALMHVNYAIGFLKATRRLASDADIQKITGSSVAELNYLMEDQQAELISSISEKCPDLGLQGVVALNAGWTG